MLCVRVNLGLSFDGNNTEDAGGQILDFRKRDYQGDVEKCIVTYQDSPITQQLNGASLLYSLVRATMKTNASS
jgi:hypothetical protein